jgi:hypothetical protein
MLVYLRQMRGQTGREITREAGEVGVGGGSDMAHVGEAEGRHDGRAARAGAGGMEEKGGVHE